MTRIGRVWYEEYVLISYLELFECCLIIDKGYNYLSVAGITGLFYEDEIATFDSFFIHGVTISAEEEIFFISSGYLGRDWYLCFDIFLRKYRHTACYSTDKGDIANRCRVSL